LYIILIPNSAIFIAHFFILANVFFGVGMLCSSTGVFLVKEGGIQVLAGPGRSNQTPGRVCQVEKLADHTSMKYNFSDFFPQKDVRQFYYLVVVA
jgi:hypothetical protein